jgi:hypothetical protein
MPSKRPVPSDLFRATLIISGDISIPTTLVHLFANSLANLPVPHPISSAFSQFVGRSFSSES